VEKPCPQLSWNNSDRICHNAVLSWDNDKPKKDKTRSDAMQQAEEETHDEETHQTSQQLGNPLRIDTRGDRPSDRFCQEIGSPFGQ
jgi:hypothetical protein